MSEVGGERTDGRTNGQNRNGLKLGRLQIQSYFDALLSEAGG